MRLPETLFLGLLLAACVLAPGLWRERKPEKKPEEIRLINGTTAWSGQALGVVTLQGSGSFTASIVTGTFGTGTLSTTLNAGNR